MSNNNDFPSFSGSMLMGSGYTHSIPCNDYVQMFLQLLDDYPVDMWMVGVNDELASENMLFSKAMSLDMRQEMPSELQRKLIALAKVEGIPFDMELLPTGKSVEMPGMVSAIAQVILTRLGYDTSNLAKERVTFTKSNAWSVDVLNPITHQVYTVNIAEPTQEDGRKKPVHIWLEGEYPEILDGLCMSLSLDMEQKDLSRILLKLKTLMSVSSKEGAIRFRNPVTNRDIKLTSMGAYLAYLVFSRYVYHFYMSKDGRLIPGHNIVSLDSHKEKGTKCFSQAM